MPTTSPSSPPPTRTPAKSVAVFLLGALSALYILNPGAGFVELIPDNIPIVGNLDEAAATVILLNCLAYFGLDLRHLFGRPAPRDPVNEAKNVTPPGGVGR